LNNNHDTLAILYHVVTVNENINALLQQAPSVYLCSVTAAVSQQSLSVPAFSAYDSQSTEGQ